MKNNNEVITLNGNEFKFENDKLIQINGDVFGKINIKKKYNQNLNSWKWFYSGFNTNLVALRYHKIHQVRNRENILVDKYINEEWNSRYLDGNRIQLKAVSFSKRFKEDRLIYNKINAELIEIQKDQNEKYQKYKLKLKQ